MTALLRPIESIVSAHDIHAPLAEASTIPGEWYTDPRVAELERRTVWSRTWVVAGRADQVASPGQLFTADIAGEPVVVVRGEDGALRAFFNVCRHHAAAVVTEPCARARSLRCPYHGWTYGLDGAFRSAPELDGTLSFDPAANSLVPVHVAEWEKLVFVHLDPAPPPLSEHLGDLVDRVSSLRLSDLTFCERRSWVLHCNWKVFVDNYLDGGYHIPFLHESLSRLLPFKAYTIETFGRACLQKSPIDPSGGDEITAQVRRGQALYYWLYPNLMLNWYEGYLDTNLVLPLAVDRTLVVFDFYFSDVGPDAAERNARSMDVSERIQAEDHGICESVQRGLSSRAYGKGRLVARREAGEHLFHRLLAHDLRRGLGLSV